MYAFYTIPACINNIGNKQNILASQLTYLKLSHRVGESVIKQTLQTIRCMNISHCFVSLRYECTLLLEEGGREGSGRYGHNSRTGVAVSEEMKEGQSGSGEHGAREGGRTERGNEGER